MEVCQDTLLRSHVEFVVPPFLPQPGSTCCICHLRKGRVVCCGHRGCTRQFHLSCLRPYHYICLPTRAGLYIRCHDHFPADFRLDKQLNAVVSMYNASDAALAREMLQMLREYAAEWTKLSSRLALQLQEVRAAMEAKQSEVVRYHRRKIEFCSVVQELRVQVERSMMESWVGRREGVEKTRSILMALASEVGRREAENEALAKRSVAKESVGIARRDRGEREKRAKRTRVSVPSDDEEDSSIYSDGEFVLEGRKRRRQASKKKTTRVKEVKEGKENEANKETKEMEENKEIKESKEMEEVKEVKENKEMEEIKEIKEVKDEDEDRNEDEERFEIEEKERDEVKEEKEEKEETKIKT